jgi:hypothetical protein
MNEKHISRKNLKLTDMIKLDPENSEEYSGFITELQALYDKYNIPFDMSSRGFLHRTKKNFRRNREIKDE